MFLGELGDGPSLPGVPGVSHPGPVPIPVTSPVNTSSPPDTFAQLGQNIFRVICPIGRIMAVTGCARRACNYYVQIIMFIVICGVAPPLLVINFDKLFHSGLYSFKYKIRLISQLQF